MQQSHLKKPAIAGVVAGYNLIMDKAVRLVFMGSPDFAVPSLERLVQAYQVIGAVTQPDRPAGRGRRLAVSPVKAFSVRAGVPLIQPGRLSEPAAMQRLRDWDPDLIVVAAFGQLLKPEVLSLPAFGCLNVHASLLPCWRGAAPIHAAILHGDEKTGVSIMKMDPGLDTGPVISRRSVQIRPRETAGELGRRLSVIGADLLLESLPGYLDGCLPPEPQDETQATYAGMLKKSDGALNLEADAAHLARQVRACNPWPGAFIEWSGQVLKIHQARELEGSLSPGVRAIVEELPALGTADGLLLLEEVQPAGKRRMAGETFLNGARDWENA